MTNHTAHHRYFLIIFSFLIFILPDHSNAGGPIHGAKGAGMGTAFVNFTRLGAEKGSAGSSRENLADDHRAKSRSRHKRT